MQQPREMQGQLNTSGFYYRARIISDISAHKSTGEQSADNPLHNIIPTRQLQLVGGGQRGTNKFDAREDYAFNTDADFTKHKKDDEDESFEQTAEGAETAFKGSFRVSR